MIDPVEEEIDDVCEIKKIATSQSFTETKTLQNIYNITITEKDFRFNIQNNILNKIINDPLKSSILEDSIYDYTVNMAKTKNIISSWDNKFVKLIYINKLKSLFYNIKHTPGLLDKITNNEIDINQIVYMSYDELYPEKWKELIEKKQLKDKSSFEQRISSHTDLFMCRKCKSNNCSYTEVQVRSADESATIYVTCLNCGKNWKQ